MRTSDPGSQVRALVRPHEIKHLSLIFRTSGAAFRSGATFGATSKIIFFEAGRGTVGIGSLKTETGVRFP